MMFILYFICILLCVEFCNCPFFFLVWNGNFSLNQLMNILLYCKVKPMVIFLISQWTTVIIDWNPLIVFMMQGHTHAHTETRTKTVHTHTHTHR